MVSAEKALCSQVDELLKAANETVSAAMKAPDLPRDERGQLVGDCPVGMSYREWNIAVDANKSSRNAPLYLVKAFDMRETALKIAAGLGDTGAPKLVQHVVHLVEARQYDRVRVGKPIVDVEARVIEEKPDGTE